MNTADSAEEIVKIYLEGVEMSLRVTGVAAKNISPNVVKYLGSAEAVRRGQACRQTVQGCACEVASVGRLDSHGCIHVLDDAYALQELAYHYRGP